MNNKEIKKKRGLREAQNAALILKSDIRSIRHVQDWAFKVRCSKTKLNRLIAKHYGISPKMLMMLVRLDSIIKVIKKHPEMGCYGVANECGLRNDKVLYQFLSRNFDTSFSELRIKTLCDSDLQF
ncbi:hypothetical protein [Gracilimonas sp.]|uniref:hypothetical protein n=1 Tax=Gracilimonas sp. TaxID=1974203 RepID=UPI003BAA11B1